MADIRTKESARAHGGFDKYQKNPYQERRSTAGLKDKSMTTNADTLVLGKQKSLDRASMDTLSDLGTKFSEKTGWILTSLTITKSYFGVGSLAIPWGFLLCGYQLALAMITVNALLSSFSCWTLVEAQKFFGSNKVRTFADLGYVCFGNKGYWFVSSIYFLH